jgi:hypothetical protein
MVKILWVIVKIIAHYIGDIFIDAGESCFGRALLGFFIEIIREANLMHRKLLFNYPAL